MGDAKPITGTAEMPILLVVERVRLTREATVAYLSGRLPHVTVMGVAGIDEIRTGLAQASVLLVPSTGEDRAELLAAISARLPGLPVVVTAEGTDAGVIRCAEAGIAGIITPTDGFAELERVLGDIVLQGIGCSAAVAGILLRNCSARADDRTATPPTEAFDGHLTPREREVLTLVELGWTNRQIADQLFIEVRTVKNHVHNVLEKLRVSRRGEAAALRTGPGAAVRP